MVNLFDDDSGFIDLPMPGAETDPETGVTDFNLGVAPPLTEQQKIDAYGPRGQDFLTNKIVDGFANMYNRLAPSEESLAELREVQETNQAIADKYNIPLKTLYAMSAYGGDNEKILEDLGFRRYTIGQDLTRSREFLYSAQQKAFNKLKEGTDFMDLSGEEMFGVVLSPLDMLDFTGIGAGLIKLARNGIAKLGSSAAKMSLTDLAKNKEVMKTLSYEEAQEVIRKLKPVIDGEQEFLLRHVKGKPKKKKQTGTLTTKDEIFPGGLPLKDFDESLLQTKPVKDTSLKNRVTKPELQEARKEISQNLKNYFTKKKDFTKKDLEDNVVTNIFEKSFNKIGLQRSNLEGNIREDYVRLNKTINPKTNEPYIDDQLLKEITAYQNKRKTLSGAIADRIKAKDEVATTRASEATEFLGKKQKGIDAPIQMNKIVLYDQLAKAMPDSYKAGISTTRKREIISELVEKNPELNKYLGLQRKVDEDTLAPEPPGITDARRKEVEVELRKNYPNELIEGVPTKTGKNKPDFFLSEKKDVASIQQNPTFKFYEFLSRTMPETSMKQLFKNVKIGDPADLANPGQRLFNSFKKLEDIRKIVSPKIKPLLERVYGIKNPSVQIAHTFKSSKLTPPEGIGKKEPFLMDIDPEEFIAQGVNPDFLYLDISPYNIGIQNFLEGAATKALRTGDAAEFDKIDQLMTNVGIKGMVDNVPIGKQKKLSTKLKAIIAELRQRGDPIPEYDDIMEAIKILESSGPGGYAYGGMVEDDLDIFEEQSNDLPEGSYEVANLMLPFFKLFGKAPINEVAPIPTPKEKLTNPTKKQTQSLETEKAKRAEEDIFDPTPNEPVELDPTMPVEVTPITQQPMTSVFYSDIERAMTNAPDQFANKQELLDFLNKNRIKKSEVDDYRINALLRLYDDNMPIPKGDVLSQVRTAPISGMKVHATGSGSEIINPNGEKATRYSSYFEPGSIPDSIRERVLYINRDKLPGDSGEYPRSMFGGETIQRHDFGIPNEEDTYIIGWTRLTDRYGFVPPKVAGPETKINLRQTTKELNKNKRSLEGLYAETKSKLSRLAGQRDFNQADIDEIMEEFGDTFKPTVVAKYADQIDQVSPGLVDQMDELIVKNRELQEQITKASGVDPSGVVRVTFADEIQSDLLQAAAGRKQQLTAALRKIQEEGNTTNLQGLNRLAEATMNFYEKNKSVFRPLKKTDAEVNVLAERVAKMDEQVDEIVNKYIQTREVSDADLSKLSTLLNDNLDTMMKELIDIDSNAIDGLFPDLPFKNRDEWADALIKKDLYELAYRKFVLKDPDASSYYAVSPSKYVSDRYSFQGNAATSEADRAADKVRRFEAFKRDGQFLDSKYKGIGMDEFYGGPNSVSNVIDNSGTAATNPNFGKPKHYTSTIETILKKQAQSNNSEMITMPVQLKGGKGTTHYRVTDQNGNMVATLTNPNQATELTRANPNYKIEPIAVPNKASMEPVFAIKITPEMLEPYKTHKAQGGLVEHIDIFEV